MYYGIKRIAIRIYFYIILKASGRMCSFLTYSWWDVMMAFLCVCEVLKAQKMMKAKELSSSLSSSSFFLWGLLIYLVVRKQLNFKPNAGIYPHTVKEKNAFHHPYIHAHTILSSRVAFSYSKGQRKVTVLILLVAEPKVAHFPCFLLLCRVIS